MNNIFRNLSDRTRWLFVISGGIAVSLSWWGAPFIFLLTGFVPLLIVEDDIQSRKEPVLSLLPYSFLFFFCWNLVACWWMIRIHLLGGTSVLVLNSVFMTIVFLLYSLIKRRTGGGAFIFVILWTGFEFLHYKGDLSWPWLSLGNGLAGNIKLIQWYEFTGTTGGSLWVLLVNVMLFSVIRLFSFNSRIYARYLLTCMLALLIILPPAVSIYIYNSYKERGAETGFLILQPGLDPYDEKYSTVTNYERLSNLLTLAENNIDFQTSYIVSPETSVDSVWITNPADKFSMQVYQFLGKYPGTGMILGATGFSKVSPERRTFTTRVNNEGDFFDIYNSALFYYEDAELQAYHKHYLANGVEQIPFQRIFGFMKRLSIDLGGISGSLKRGYGPGVFRSPAADSLVLGTLICFESVYGEYASGMVKKGAEILIVISNDGWFRNTGAYRQHLRASRIRAIETRRSVVRSANTGVSAYISQTGKIVDQVDWWEGGALSVNVTRNDRITFFTKYGDYPGRTALFFSLLMILNLLVRVIPGLVENK